MMQDRIRNNPAVAYSLAEATAALLAGYGLDMTARQTAAVLAVLAVVTGLATRAAVYGPKTVDRIMDADSVISQAERGGINGGIESGGGTAPGARLPHDAPPPH